MPKNLLNDRDIDEFYVNIQPSQLQFHYVDYHYTTRIGAAYTRPAYIPAGLAPSYVLPTTIDCIGHWNDAGFQSSVYVVKTELTSTALLTQYLGYVPFNNHTVAMYDYFMTVQLNTGFGAATNRIYTLPLHRGFSAHQRTVGAAQVWVGDYLTTVAAPAPGVYEKVISLGIEFVYRAVRTDNIYSDTKYVTVDNTQIPPKKYLDIYESINPPVLLSFTVNVVSGNATNTFGAINFIGSIAQLPPNFVVQGVVNFSRVTGRHSIGFTYTGPATQIDRATYTLGFRFRFTGEDFRAYNTALAVWNYDTRTTGWDYSNGGRSLRGLLNLNNAGFDNFLLQNKSTLRSAFVSANTATIISFARTSVSATDNRSLPFIDFNITGRFSRGYAELTDATGLAGMNLTFPKIVRVVPQLKIYDKDHIYTNDNIYYAIKSPQGNTNLDQVPSSWNASQTLSFTNFDSRAFVTQATRSLANYLPAGTSVQVFNKATQNNYLGKQLLTIDLDARVGGAKLGAALNTRDSNTDAAVYMRGQMIPAMTYNRRTTLDLTSIFNVVNLLNKPTNSITGIYLNAYRYLRFTVNAAPGLVNLTQPYRLTIWESAADKIIEKYWNGTITFPGRTSVTVTIDLLFPNYPGLEIDTQDDPYPRSRNIIDANEKVNNVYYGCNRVLRIDLTSNGNVFDPVAFSCQALIIPTATNADILNFIPSSGTDLNLKEIEVPTILNNITTSTYGRRFLLMRHDNKPEEETDIVYNSVGGVLTKNNLTVLDFVNRLNSLHNGLNCTSLNNTLPAVNLQGFHWNISSTAIKDNTSITVGYNTTATINASEIYQGVYLDFPPFIQDFNNHAIADTWLNQVNPLRRLETDTVHMEIRAYCNLRGYAYGSESDANNLPLTGANKLSNGEVFVSGGGVDKSSTSITTSSGTILNGFYTTGRPHVYPPYDYLTSQNNSVSIRIGAAQVGNFSTFAKFLPAKATRVSFGFVQPYIANPYISLASGYNYVSANEILTKNQIAVCLGQTYNSLSPYISPSSATAARLNADGLLRILLINSYDNQSYDLVPISNSASLIKNGFNPNLIIKNTSNDLTSNLFTESYYNGNVSNSIAFNNPSLLDENSWYYYDDPQYIMSKCFAFTDNNSYSSSPYHNDLYCLGTLRNTLFLQKTSFDRILQISSAAQYSQAPNAPEQVYLLDGANYTGTEFTGVISSGTNTGIVNKPGSIVQIDDNILLAFYNLSADLTNIYCRLIEYGVTSARITLVNSGAVSSNILTALSNVSAIFDPVFNVVRFVFMASLTVSGTNYNNIIYAESPYVDGTISSPTLFHHIAGNYTNGQFIANNVFYTATNNDNQVLPYQKPGIVVYNNSDQKGQVGIFYVNNSGALCSTSIIPFVSTDPKIEYK